MSKSVRMSPRKVRLIADAVKKHTISDAREILSQVQKRAASAILKTLESALANAKNNAKLDTAVLRIKSIEVSEGPALKRFHPSTRGRVHPYKKRTSHIKVILEEVLKK